jgi:hypothetical protein
MGDVWYRAGTETAPCGREAFGVGKIYEIGGQMVDWLPGLDSNQRPFD